MTEFFQLVAVVICMGGSAFFSGIETGMISIHRMRLRHAVRQGEPDAGILEMFLDDPDRLLGTTLTGNNFFNVLASVLATSLGHRLHGTLGETIAVTTMTLAVLLLGEYLPKAWFHGRPLVRSLRFARLLRAFDTFFRPLSVAAVKVTRLLVPGPKAGLSETVPFVTREDLLTLAQQGEQHGVLSRDERVMIHRVFALSGKLARQIMIPRDRMVTADAESGIEAYFEQARAAGFTRMPVYDASRKEYVGVVNVMYVLSQAKANAQRRVRWFARPPLFVHERTPVDDILPLMRRFRQPMCLVQNDREEVTGMLTTEDILDEIVGSIGSPPPGPKGQGK